MTFTVFGTGAVGAYYGARLARAGHTVHFLVRSDYEVIKEKGLTVLSPEGDIYLDKPSVFNSPEAVPPSDVILIALKTTGNKNLKEQLKPLIARNTAILILQNGMGMEEEMASWFPSNPVLGGMCFICSRKKAPALIEHLDKGAVTLGCGDERDRALRDSLYSLFNEAGIETSVVENLREARWRKLLWNIPYNGLSVVLNSDTRELMTTEGARELVEGLMEEVLAGAAACRCPIEREAMEKMLHYTEIMTPYEPSMKQDYMAGRPMEIEYMYEIPLAQALENGCDMKKVRMLKDQLHFIQNRNLQKH
ncbi:MAG: putative 2-dehydropantoate 2-reductase [Spirochaetales bacterium]|nr:putative 2-dehydropantoate 2-reductase [Spirochaetales bacterium]